MLVTGHSLGGCLATLSAYEIATTFPRTRVCMVSFGASRVVSHKLASAFGMLPNMRAYRVVNGSDVVTRVPPNNAGFAHVGSMIWLRRGKVHETKPFGHTPWQIRLMPFEVLLGRTAGLADHPIDSYLDVLLHGSWENCARHSGSETFLTTEAT